MDQEYVTALVRHGMTALGGFAVAQGWTDSGTVETIIGGSIAAIGLVWSLLHKKPIVQAKKDNAV